MKPFDLEEAKKGKLIRIAKGNPARIICYDAMHELGYCIIALIKLIRTGEELPLRYRADGTVLDTADPKGELTLCMLED